MGGKTEKLNNKVCVVTGAARSIGLGITERFCTEGAHTVMIDINPLVKEAAGRLESLGHSVSSFILDITDRNAVFDCFREIEKRTGPVYTLINNAGIVGQKPFEEITPEELHVMFNVNVYGTLYCCQAAVKSMKSRQNGRIINFSSKSGKTGSALMAHYSAAKGAIISLTHALAFELAPYNINVNCVCPGITDESGVWEQVSSGYVNNLNLSREEVIEKFTAKIPLKRLCAIADVVDFVYFLTTSGDYCTGQSFNITGGREVH